MPLLRTAPVPKSCEGESARSYCETPTHGVRLRRTAGHTASAFAFAAGAPQEAPPLAAPLLDLAATGQLCAHIVRRGVPGIPS